MSIRPKTRATTHPTRAGLERLARAVRASILTTHRPDSCIATTRAVVDACRQQGWDARELPVVVTITNGRLIALIAAHGERPVDDDVVAHWRAAGGHMIRLGDAPPDVPLIGHLVALVDRHTLVDASLDQASRPAKGILLDAPLITDARCAFAGLVRMGTTVLRYQETPENRAYELSPDWVRWERTRDAVAAGVAAYGNRGHAS